MKKVYGQFLGKFFATHKTAAAITGAATPEGKAYFATQERKKELLFKLAELNKLQTQQNSNHQPRAEVKSRRKI